MTDKQRWFYLILFWIVNFCLGSFYAWSIYSSWLADLYTQTAGQTVSVASLTYNSVSVQRSILSRWCWLAV